MAPRRLFPRRAKGPRPILTQDQIMDLCQQVIDMTTTHDAEVTVGHATRSFTRLSGGHVQTSNDGDVLNVWLKSYGAGGGIQMTTDQIDTNVLRELVRNCEAAALDKTQWDEPIFNEQFTQDEFVPVQLWHDSTVEAMHNSRSTLLPELLQPVAKAGMEASGFVGFLARARGVIDKQDKLRGYYEETDCEISVTARTADGTGSGWGGQASREWSAIDPGAVTARAIDVAQRSVNPKAMEPGRQTVILTREAVAQLFRYFSEMYDAGETESTFPGAKGTPFTRHGTLAPGMARNKVGDRVFDERISMWSNPDDPDGGFSPYFYMGYKNPRITWAKDGVLKNLAWFIGDAALRHLPYSEWPNSLHVSGGPTSVEQMIAQCSEGVFVNQFSGVDMVDMASGMLTGVTRDGCFLVKNGKLDIPIKNFRFMDSPVFMLNNLIALGESKRAAYGYAPPGKKEWSLFGLDGIGTFFPFPGGSWPRAPMIVPPLMVRDFNFTSLADSV